MGKYTQDCKELLEYVGGKSNVAAVAHCMTRMRFVLNDPGKADIKKIETVEAFHHKIQAILSSEMSSEVERLELLIATATDEVAKMEAEQRALGLPTRISKKFLEQVAEINRKISILQKQNEGKKKNDDLKKNTTDSRIRMEEARTSQLETVQTILNQEMTRLNDFIYNATRYAPEIRFGNAEIVDI